MKKISAGQAAIIMFIAFCSSKFLTMPSALAIMVGRDLWIVAVIAFTIEIVPIIFILNFMQKYPDKNFYQILQQIFGKFFAKIIIVFYVSIFLFKLVFLSKEIHNFLVDALYDRMQWELYLIPTLLITGYVVYQGLRTIGRISQIWIYIIVFALIVAYIVGLISADLTNTLPILEKGFGLVFYTAVKHFLNFNDLLVLLMFLGNVKPEKNMTKKIWFGIGMAMFVTVAFFVLFNAVYDRLAIANRQGIADIAQFIPHISSVLRLDWFTTLIWIGVILLKFSVLTYCVYICFLWILGLQKSGYVLLGVCVITYFFSIIPSLNISLFAKIFYSTPMTIIGIAQYVVPYMFPIFLLVMKKNQKKISRNKINGLLISEAYENA